jgi:prolyl 4-hydroxylase
MFERITTEDYYIQRFQPNILSQPPEGPWVVTVENVATPEECKHLIALGAKRGYEQSQDVGARKFDGTFHAHTSDTRTSSNAWCVEECFEDPTNQNILQTVENITGIPDANSEYWQLLEYEETEFYGHHHDYIPHHKDRSQGVRILTVFVYLNDVEEGGGTHFQHLDITVQPKPGRALIWPSVMDRNPNRKDSRTHHEALPVKKGIKYGANAWFHQRDFKTPYAQKCT